jgi:lipopolysaccharide/colanic/teichoic acid biosynthesis glycosyltransferase
MRIQKTAQSKSIQADNIEDERPACQPRSGLPRSFDLILSFIGLVLSAPLLLITTAAIALTSSGSVLFRQQRVGRHGELFVLYKLRTMIASDTGPQVTSGSDARITRVGRFLRSTKLDELPTLWNVLKGDMAIVGPRPEVPRYVDPQNPLWRMILAVRPGITDPVTMRLRNEEGLLSQVEGDVEAYYINNLQPLKLQGYIAYLNERNWRSDLKVIGKTAKALFITKADGLTEENPWAR